MLHRHLLACIVVIGLSAGPCHLAAQPIEQRRTLSFDEAVQMAITNNPEIRSRLLRAQAASTAVDEAQVSLLPSVDLSYDLQRNLIIPVTPVPSAIFDPNAPAGAITPLRFATGWTSAAGVLASFKIFDPSVHGAVDERRIQAAMSETDRQLTQVDVETQVGLAYTDCVIAREQVRFAVADTAYSATVTAAVRDRFIQGRCTVSDVNDALTDLNNARSRLDEAQRIARSAEGALFYALGYPSSVGSGVALTDSLAAMYQRFRSLSDDVVSDTSSLTYVKNSQQLSLTESQHHYTSLGFLPTITLNGYYGANYYNNTLTFGDPASWFGNSYVSLSVRLPLTADLQRAQTLSKLSIQRDVDQQELIAAMNKRRRDLDRARTDHAHFQADYLIKQQNIVLAEQSFRSALQQFAEGRLTTSDLSRAELAIQRANNDFLHAALNYVQAAITLIKLKRS